MSSRREWLGQSTSAALLLGLPREWRAALPLASPRPHLELALQCARWIERSRQVTEAGVRWPANPEKPDSVQSELYNGMAGVVVFLAELHRATGDEAWRRSAEQGADYLIHEATSRGNELECGLYTGLAGIGFAVASVATGGGDPRYDQAARNIFDRLKARAKPAGDGVEWNDGYDIIAGSAGIGLALLYAHERWHDDDALRLATLAGRRLVAAGTPAERGTMWFPSASLKRNYPNFSHGTSGVGYFLATLHQRAKDPAFLTAALAGADYLDSVATRQGGGTLIFHHEPGGRDLYYLSWCHGPAGTARLFYRLHRTTGDARWLEWVHSLTRGLLATHIPEDRPPGFWQNISQCCGNVGVGQFFLDLERYLKDSASRVMIERVVTDTMKRATRDDAGARWVQAENRTEPENLVAQTGFMQGAAGVGTFLLRLDYAARGKRWAIDFPDTPFVG